MCFSLNSQRTPKKQTVEICTTVETQTEATTLLQQFINEGRFTASTRFVYIKVNVHEAYSSLQASFALPVDCLMLYSDCDQGDSGMVTKRILQAFLRYCAEDDHMSSLFFKSLSYLISMYARWVAHSFNFFSSSFCSFHGHSRPGSTLPFLGDCARLRFLIFFPLF